MSAVLEKPVTVNLTIQQMAKQSGLSEHTLRYYERIGLISPVQRDDSSGHRRYSPDTVEDVERLVCLRGTGMPIEDMREYLRLREQGISAASEQKALFAAYQETLDHELELLLIRRKYIAGKVAFWEAVEAGDMVRAKAIGENNAEVARAMISMKENI